MTNKPRKPNHEADISNPNKGSTGVNETYKKNRDNRSRQLNPNDPINKRPNK